MISQNAYIKTEIVINLIKEANAENKYLRFFINRHPTENSFELRFVPVENENDPKPLKNIKTNEFNYGYLKIEME